MVNYNALSLLGVRPICSRPIRGPGEGLRSAARSGSLRCQPLTLPFGDHWWPQGPHPQAPSGKTHPRAAKTTRKAQEVNWWQPHPFTTVFEEYKKLFFSSPVFLFPFSKTCVFTQHPHCQGQIRCLPSCCWHCNSNALRNVVHRDCGHDLKRLRIEVVKIKISALYG